MSEISEQLQAMWFDFVIVFIRFQYMLSLTLKFTLIPRCKVLGVRARSHSIMCKEIPPYQASAVFEIIDGRTAHTDHGHGFLVSFPSPLFLMVTRKSTFLSIKNVVERRRQLTCILAMWRRIVPWTPLPVAKLILPIFSRTGRCDERLEMKFYLLLCIPFSKTNHDLSRQLVRD